MIEEASTNFDLEQVEPFLQRLSSQIEEGLGLKELAHILELVNRMECDDEERIDLQVVYRGHKMPLSITVFMDDVDAPDIGFFTFPALAQAIDREIEKMVDGL